MPEIKTIEDFEGLMDFLFDSMNVSFKALRVMANFIDKENAQCLESHLSSLEDCLRVGKNKIIELKENFKIISIQDIKYFTPDLIRKIKEKQIYIKDCNERIFLPEKQQRQWKKQLKKELKPLLELANKYNIKIE